MMESDGDRKAGRYKVKEEGEGAQDAHQEAGSSDTLESLAQPAQAAHKVSGPG